MAYQSALEARLARKTTRAIKTFNLIEEGDRMWLVYPAEKIDEH